MLTFEEFKKRSASSSPSTGGGGGNGSMGGARTGPMPQAPRKSGLEKAGNFLAPTLTKTIKEATDGDGEAPSARQLIGSGLEVASYVVPAGAIMRGGRAIFQGAKAARGAKKANELETVIGGAKNIGSKTKKIAKEGATVGGTTGFLAGTGRGLGDEDKTVTEALGEGVATGVGGAVLGGVGGPVIGGSSALIKKSVQAPSNAFKRAQETLNPTDRTQTVEDVTEALRDSFVQDKPGTLNKLEGILDRSARREGQEFTEDSLLREVVEEGYIPKVDGQVARFRDEAEHATERIARLAEGVDELARDVEGTIPLSNILREAREDLTGRIDVDMAKATRQLNQIGKTLANEFGENVDATAINQIRKKMNQATKSFDKDSFILDSAEAMAQSTRRHLNEMVPGAQDLNNEAAKLFRIKETMRALNNSKIEVGFLTSAFGRLLGTMGGAGAGLSVAGPGGLVLAGVLANLGAQGVANIIRQARFNPNVRNILRQGLKADEKLLNKVKEGASKADKALIERLMKSTPRLPAPAEGAPRSQSGSGATLFSTQRGSASPSRQEAFDAASRESGRITPPGGARQSLRDIPLR